MDAAVRALEHVAGWLKRRPPEPPALSSGLNGWWDDDPPEELRRLNDFPWTRLTSSCRRAYPSRRPCLDRALDHHQ